MYIDSDIASPTGNGGGDAPQVRAVNAEAAEYYGGQPVHSRARTLSTVGTPGSAQQLLTSRPGSELRNL